MTRRFLLACVGVTLLALILREYYVLATVVKSPFAGDVRQYVAYAWNLLQHGVFSNTWPDGGAPRPDTFRSPGYPALLACLMWFSPQGWYPLALFVQATLGALTVTMTILLARHWLPASGAITAGLLVAMWPHQVTAAGTLLTEVTFGFLLVLALLLAAEALQRRSNGWAAASGLAFSGAALTSMMSLLFPIFIAWLFLRNRLPRAAALLVALSMVGPGLWALRDTTVQQPSGQPGRMVMNFVQGSWPQYHRAWLSAFQDGNPIAHDILREIDHESRLLASRPEEGASRILKRIEGDPGYYLEWYLLEKPYLLWDWDIRLGAGDVYFHLVRQSPLETNAPLLAIKRGLEFLNPVIFTLSAAASIALLVGWLRRSPWATPAAALVAGFCVYVTLLHVVFQAEPRYSIPYRPMQMLMLASALSFLVRRGRGRSVS